MRLRVGLTGGIGSGKSEAARAFAALGALVIDADALAREAVAPGSVGLARIVERWPNAVDRAGRLDRAALGRIVFPDASAREALEAIVHPFVRERGAELEANAGPDRIVVHDVPLLFEAGFYRACDANVVVIAEVDLRVERILARSETTEDEIRRRMRAQIDPERAIELADYTLVNEGTLPSLAADVADVYADLLERRPRRVIAS